MRPIQERRKNEASELCCLNNSQTVCQSLQSFLCNVYEESTLKLKTTADYIVWTQSPPITDGKHRQVSAISMPRFPLAWTSLNDYANKKNLSQAFVD